MDRLCISGFGTFTHLSLYRSSYLDGRYDGCLVDTDFLLDGCGSLAVPGLAHLRVLQRLPEVVLRILQVGPLLLNSRLYAVPFLALRLYIDFMGLLHCYRSDLYPVLALLVDSDLRGAWLGPEGQHQRRRQWFHSDQHSNQYTLAPRSTRLPAVPAGWSPQLDSTSLHDLQLASIQYQPVK